MFASENIKKRYKDIVYKEWEKAINLMRVVHSSFKLEYFKNIDKIIERFLDLKGDLIPYFNDDLRLRIDINLERDSLTRKDIELVFMSWKCEKGKKLFNNKNKYKVLDDYNCVLDWVIEMLEEFTVEEMIQGRVLSNTRPLGGRIRFQEGTKLSKVIIAYYNQLVENSEYRILGNSIHYKDVIRELILDYYSQIISSIKEVEGTVVLSINPVDFMLVSAHTDGGWRSCHNYIDGGHRIGGFSYSMDKHSLVAYAYKKEKEYATETFREVLPLKVWRQMVFLDRENRSAIFAKEYPGPSPMFSKYTRKLTGRLLAHIHKIEPVWKVCAYKDNEISDILENEEKENNIFISVGKQGYWHYPDPLVSGIRMKNGGHYSEIKVGAEYLICPICGCKRNDQHQKYICQDCVNCITHCYECGKKIYKFDSYKDMDNDFFCMDCYEKIKNSCKICGREGVKYEFKIVNEDVVCRSGH